MPHRSPTSESQDNCLHGEDNCSQGIWAEDMMLQGIPSRRRFGDTCIRTRARRRARRTPEQSPAPRASRRPHTTDTLGDRRWCREDTGSDDTPNTIRRLSATCLRGRIRADNAPVPAVVRLLPGSETDLHEKKLSRPPPNVRLRPPLADSSSTLTPGWMGCSITSPPSNASS